MVQDLLCDPEVVIIIQDIQILQHGFIGEFMAGKAHQLVENREGIPHGSVGFLRDDVQRIFAGADLLLLCYILKVTGNVIHRDSPEVEDLTA